MLWTVLVVVLHATRKGEVLLEAAGQVYAHVHGLSVLVTRCGWCPRDPEHAAELRRTPFGKDSYLSPGDAGRCFAAAVELDPAPPFAAVFATSRPVGRPRYDLEPDGEGAAPGARP